MAKLIFTFERTSIDIPWIVWFQPYAESVFTNNEIVEKIQPTRDGLAAQDGFESFTVTEPTPLTLHAEFIFNTVEQAKRARHWLSEQVTRRDFIQDRLKSNNTSYKMATIFED
jgi:hypothetical protein